MRQLGYWIPERYRHPVMSRSPAEFWRRWNTYVGGWAHAYVFVPLVSALRLSSKRGRNSARTNYAIAVVLTFTVVGVLHDAFIFAASRVWSGSVTPWFVGMALLVVVWETVGAKIPRVARRGWGGALVSRGLFFIAACYAAAKFP